MNWFVMDNLTLNPTVRRRGSLSVEGLPAAPFLLKGAAAADRKGWG
ncbi:MAG: hypothetical protein U0X91_18905 [Spirosomataceae bacterium]